MIKAPKTIVMVRHGRTEANDVYSARRKGLPVDLAAEIKSVQLLIGDGLCPTRNRRSEGRR